MIEDKRFTFMQDTLAKADVFDEDEFVCCTLSVWVEQLVDLLNNLNDENEQLKQDIARYRGNFREMEDVKCELAEENEELKKELFDFKQQVYDFEDVVDLKNWQQEYEDDVK